MTKKRAEWVDLLKGIGIILVVYGHVILGVHDAGIGFKSDIYFMQHSVIYTMHMPLFFFLSGLFASKWAQRKKKTAFLQKFKSLIIPYFLWGIIQGTIMSILSSYTNNGTSWDAILLLPIKPFAQFWFLYDLFFIFIVYFILNKLVSEKWIAILALFFAVISPLLHYWELWRITYYFVFFFAGVLFMKSNIYSKIKKNNVFIMMLFFITINIIFYKVSFDKVVNNFMTILVAFVGICLLVVLSKWGKSKVVEYLGKISLPIYLMHILATAGIRILMIKILGINSISLNIVVGLIAGILFPVIAYEILKKLKLNHVLFMEK